MRTLDRLKKFFSGLPRERRSDAAVVAYLCSQIDALHARLDVANWRIDEQAKTIETFEGVEVDLRDCT